MCAVATAKLSTLSAHSSAVVTIPAFTSITPVLTIGTGNHSAVTGMTFRIVLPAIFFSAASTNPRFTTFAGAFRFFVVLVVVNADHFTNSPSAASADLNTVRTVARVAIFAHHYAVATNTLTAIRAVDTFHIFVCSARSGSAEFTSYNFAGVVRCGADCTRVLTASAIVCVAGFAVAVAIDTYAFTAYIANTRIKVG